MCFQCLKGDDNCQAKSRQQCCSMALSIQLELKVAGGKTLKRQSGKQSVEGKLQISSKLSGLWQNDDYCSPPRKLAGALCCQHSSMEISSEY